jgi:leader peptidase (prepilin peptidase)/N-methyltransferase
VGSFLNVVVHRLPLMLERQWWGDVATQLADAASFRRVFGSDAPERLALADRRAGKGHRRTDLPLGLARPRSRCPDPAATVIRWYENLPVLSWLALRGTLLSLQDSASRFATRWWNWPPPLLFGAFAWHLGPQPVVLLWCALVATLLALALIDWDTTVLPDADAATAVGWPRGGGPGLGCRACRWNSALLGVAVGYLSLWSIYWLFKLTTGKEGMGYGDFKLLAALGAWLGWKAILPIVLMASVIGAIVGLVMKASGSLREGRFVPFGPFLAGGGLVVMLLGLPRVLEWMGW